MQPASPRHDPALTEDGVDPDSGSVESGSEKAPAEVLTGLRRWLFIALGVVFVGLGGIGVILPGLPTTPFLLLASYFLIRSSPTLHRRLMRSRTFGPILAHWQEHRALSPRVKRVAIVACSVMICLSIAFGGLPWPARFLVAATGAYGIYFVSRIPVIPPGSSA